MEIILVFLAIFLLHRLSVWVSRLSDRVSDAGDKVRRAGIEIQATEIREGLRADTERRLRHLRSEKKRMAGPYGPLSVRNEIDEITR